jgi:hypothetical protein
MFAAHATGTVSHNRFSPIAAKTRRTSGKNAASGNLRAINMMILRLAEIEYIADARSACRR